MAAIRGRPVLSFHFFQRLFAWKDQLFKVITPLKPGSDCCLSPTHEEAVADVVCRRSRDSAQANHRTVFQHPLSFKYSFSTAFRNEKRAQGAGVRAREFIMCEAYSFHRISKEENQAYRAAKFLISQILEDMSLSFFSNSDDGSSMGATESVEFRAPLHPSSQCNHNLGTRDCHSVEVAHAFKLGNTYTVNFEWAGSSPPLMTCFGIGITRLVSMLLEQALEKLDQSPYYWPSHHCSPFDLIIFGYPHNRRLVRVQRTLFRKLANCVVGGHVIDVLWYNTNDTYGKMMNDIDLWGIPLRLLVDGRAAALGCVSIIYRNQSKLVPINKTAEYLKRKLGTIYCSGSRLS